MKNGQPIGCRWICWLGKTGSRGLCVCPASEARSGHDIRNEQERRGDKKNESCDLDSCHFGRCFCSERFCSSRAGGPASSTFGAAARRTRTRGGSRRAL